MSVEAPITPLPIPLGDTRAIIVFGGSFDPVHRAHVDLPVLARAVAQPDAWLLYVPAARSPLKPRPGTGDADRLAMLRLALAGVERAAVWTDELDRAAWQATHGATAPSFTIDTLARLRRAAPRAPLRLLIGADQAAELHRWREPRAIIAAAPPMLLARAPLTDRVALTAALTSAGAWTEHEVEMIAGSLVAGAGTLPPSSTGVRTALARGERAGAASHLHPEVARYIEAHGLYRPTTN